MKRFLLTIFIACSVSIAWSQTAKRTTAYNFLRNGKLDKALENIEPCLTHPKTMNEAKTWFYRGNIYLQIGLSEKPEYKALSDNPFQIAYESYQKALTLEGANEFKLDIIQNMNVIAEGFYVKGVERFNGQDYSSAANLFIEAAKVKEEIGVFDTAAVYNAGLCAELSNDNKLALTQYRKVYEAGLRKPNIYTSLINVSLKSGDTTTAMNYATEGLQLFPEDFSILIAETNIFLAKNMTEQALKNLEIAKSLDQTNPYIFFAVGVSYDRLGNFQKAEEAYLKAIELKPDYFDAIYNLGALYVNKAATTLDEANLLPLEKEKEYNEMKNLAESHLDKAIPFLEKAHQLDPKDRNTIASLKEIYARKGNVEKAKEMDEKLKMQ